MHACATITLFLIRGLGRFGARYRTNHLRNNFNERGCSIRAYKPAAIIAQGLSVKTQRATRVSDARITELFAYRIRSNFMNSNRRANSRVKFRQMWTRARPNGPSLFAIAGRRRPIVSTGKMQAPSRLFIGDLTRRNNERADK